MKRPFIFLIMAAMLAVGTFDATGQPTTRTTRPARPATQTAAAAAPQQAFKVPFVNKKLANGLEVIVYPDKGVPLVTVELAVRNGSFTEPPELNGLSHLYEHMIFKPNAAGLLVRCQMSAREGPLSDYGRQICNPIFDMRNAIGDVSYLDTIGQLGISYNGATREEVVYYYFSTSSKHLETALRFMRDSARFPVFDEEELAREKEVVIGEIDRNESNPFFYLNRELMERLFYKYPSRKNPLGSRETVSGATVEKMRLIQERYYVPNNSAVVVTGDAEPEEVFRLVEQMFGDWKKRERNPFDEFPMVEHPAIEKSAGYIVEQPVQNVLMQIGWHGPSIGKDDEATYAADVFSYILTQPDSRFQRNLVDSGLAVGAEIGYYTQRNVGPIVLTLVTTPDKAKAALNAAYAEVAAFDQANYYTDTELSNAKTILESRDLFEREKLSEYAHTLSFWWSSTGIEYFRGYHQMLRATTRADINRYVRTYIKGKPHITVALISSDAQRQAGLTAADLIGK
ncbi:MAG: insulinase family protein [Acidobacteriota bacterium]|nr:MAG: insulinase family protein [Acidobacteriota bacterium]